MAQGVPGHKPGADSLLRTSAVSAYHADRLVPLTTPNDGAAASPPCRFTSNHLGAQHGLPPSRYRRARVLRLASVVVGAAIPGSCGRVRAAPITGFRISSCTGVSATARASGRVLRTTAVSTSRTDRHSIAVVAPMRALRPRRFPVAYSLDLSFLTACRGFDFSHLPHRGALSCLVCERVRSSSSSTPSHDGKGASSP